MLTLFGKKKISENKMANVVINGVMTMVDQGFDEVCGLIEDDPEFETPPQLNRQDSYPFTIIVLAGNLKRIPLYFPAGKDQRIISLCLTKAADVFGMDKADVEDEVKEYQSYMSRINHPSKNVVLAMAKAVFHVYNLNPYQEEYFRNLETPNPMFLKRMREMMGNFLWDWDYWLEQYKIV